MYVKFREISISDIIRSKILKEEEQILKIFELIQFLQFGSIRVEVSTSNRNAGKSLYFFKKKGLDDILSTPQGRARFNLFRLNADLYDQ